MQASKVGSGGICQGIERVRNTCIGNSSYTIGDVKEVITRAIDRLPPFNASNPAPLDTGLALVGIIRSLLEGLGIIDRIKYAWKKAKDPSYDPYEAPCSGPLI